MENREGRGVLRFKPKFDKLYYITSAVAVLLVLAAAVPVSVLDASALFIVLPVAAFVLYFLVSPLFGYVELREEEVFVRFGLILTRRIPYSVIHGAEKQRRFYADSMLSLKNALTHVNIKYNSFDVISVSVTENDLLMEELKTRSATL